MPAFRRRQVEVGDMEGVIPGGDVSKVPVTGVVLPSGLIFSLIYGAVGGRQGNGRVRGAQSSQWAAGQRAGGNHIFVGGGGGQIKNHCAVGPAWRGGKAVVSRCAGVGRPLRLGLYRHGNGEGVVPAVTEFFRRQREGGLIQPVQCAYHIASELGILPVRIIDRLCP